VSVRGRSGKWSAVGLAARQAAGSILKELLAVALTAALPRLKTLLKIAFKIIPPS
jgi:hypothetical protein